MHDKQGIIRHSSLFLAISLLLSAPVVLSAPQTVAPEAWLLEQIRIGEATHKDDLVRQSLYRLEAIEPDNVQVMSARIRLLLREGDTAEAVKLVQRLKEIAPDSETYRTSALALKLFEGEGREKLQEARLLATGGQLEKAKALYDQLFDGAAPTLDLAIEYWQLVARLPNQQNTAIKNMQQLDATYPGSVTLRLALADLLFSQNKMQEAYAVLKKVAADPAGREAAIDAWSNHVKEMSVSEQSVAQLQQFITHFDGTPQAQQARVQLEQQQKLLADPAYRARIRGLERIDHGQGRTAIADLQLALKESPDDAQLLGALGQAFSRAGQLAKALMLYRQAQKADTAGDFGDKWTSLIKSTEYWLLLEQGDNALKQKNLTLAQQRYQRAYRLDNSEAAALVGLGDVAVARQDMAQAERYYKQAQRLEPDNSSALRGLVNIYQTQSPEKALAYLNSLSPRQRNQMRSTLNSLQADSLKTEAEQLMEMQRWAEAETKLREAAPLAPDDIWLRYRLARTLHEQGKTREGDDVFARYRASHAIDDQYAYAYALYLSSSDRDNAALLSLAELPESQWNENMQALAQRLRLQQTLDRANALRDEGKEREAIAYLKRQPEDTRIELTLADWAAQREDNQEALAIYQRVLKRAPDNQDALLGKIEILLAEGKTEEARQQLVASEALLTPDSLNTGRRLANVWQLAGEEEKARRLFEQYKAQALQASPSQNSAWLLRDLARFETAQRDPKQALQNYRHAMQAASISKTAELDDETFTRLTRNTPTDDWLQRSIRSDAADLYRQQSTVVTLDYDYWGSSGTPGYSDLKAQTTMLQVDTPLYDGTAFFRSDFVQMDAGRFSQDSDGLFVENFGTCALGCTSEAKQKADGVSLAVGWQSDRWQVDIGTTPLGFDVEDWVGGISYNNDWKHVGWTLTASRRPISSSLLSFGGTKDPNTGIRWGGIRATGASLGLSYDRGGPHGIWSDISFHQLTGEYVPDNQRARFMAGYYYKLVNEDNRRVTIGLNNMLWHFQRDLSGYTLGQGGYYSPQQYVSFSVPVNYRERTENWSWEIGGSVSWSYSKTKDSAKYPLNSSWPERDQLCGQLTICNTTQARYDAFISDQVNQGDSGSGFGYTARAVIERRLNSHWSIGAGVDIQQAKNYTPSHALLFLRYRIQPWQGDMDLPPQPLTPYADFK